MQKHLIIGIRAKRFYDRKVGKGCSYHNAGMWCYAQNICQKQHSLQ